MSQQRRDVWELMVNPGHNTGKHRRPTFTFYGNKTEAQHRLREVVADF